MKKLALVLVVMLLTQISVSAAKNSTTYKKKNEQKVNTAKPQQPTLNQILQENDNNYLLKYNINDLEVAPWLNGGKRKI